MPVIFNETMPIYIYIERERERRREREKFHQRHIHFWQLYQLSGKIEDSAFRFLSFSLYWSKLTKWQILWGGAPRLGDPFVSQSPKEFSDQFSTTDFSLSIYYLSVWTKISLLHSSLWITFKHPVIPTLVFLLCQFAAFEHYVNDCFISVIHTC